MGFMDFIRKTASNTLKNGPIPQHVAIIMDGNRRFARKMNVECKQGHSLGFEKLKETLEWCLDLGITMVTVYAFSIENFKRAKSEVDALMELANSAFAQLSQQTGLIQEHGVCMRFFGDISLLPHDVQVSVARCVNMSKHNTRATLNVCFAYTARDEIVRASREIVRGVEEGLLLPEDASEELLERCLDSEDAPEPDLLIRTSGEVRLSDFLLWQTSFSFLAFRKVLWPEFSFWDLFQCILSYQRNATSIKAAREENIQARIQRQVSEDSAAIAARNVTDPAQVLIELSRLDSERKSRVCHFLKNLRHQRELFYLNLAPDAVVA